MTTTIFGRTIPTEVDELFDPAHTAIVVVDPQNDFLHPDGIAAKRGTDVALLRRPLPNISAFLGRARTIARLTVFLQFTQAESGVYLTDSDLARLIRDGNGDVPAWAIEGSWGHEFIPELQPHDTDVIVKKHRASGFAGTDLDLVLRTAGIRAVLLTGVTTSGCVMYTARDAMMHDYFVGVLTDCIGSQRQDWHDATILLMRRLFHFVGDYGEFSPAWGSPGQPAL